MHKWGDGYIDYTKKGNGRTIAACGKRVSVDDCADKYKDMTCPSCLATRPKPIGFLKKMNAERKA